MEPPSQKLIPIWNAGGSRQRIGLLSHHCGPCLQILTSFFITLADISAHISCGFCMSYSTFNLSQPNMSPLLCPLNISVWLKIHLLEKPYLPCHKSNHWRAVFPPRQSTWPDTGSVSSCRKFSTFKSPFECQAQEEKTSKVNVLRCSPWHNGTWNIAENHNWFLMAGNT